MRLFVRALCEKVLENKIKIKVEFLPVHGPFREELSPESCSLLRNKQIFLAQCCVVSVGVKI